MDEAERAVREELKAKYLKADDLQQYAIAGAVHASSTAIHWRGYSVQCATCHA